MEINDLKDTIDLDTVTRRFLNLLQEDFSLGDAVRHFDDLRMIRLSVLFLWAILRLDLPSDISAALVHAANLAIAYDPALVEETLFLSNNFFDEEAGL